VRLTNNRRVLMRKVALDAGFESAEVRKEPVAAASTTPQMAGLRPTNGHRVPGVWCLAGQAARSVAVSNDGSTSVVGALCAGDRLPGRGVLLREPKGN
jgi:hypothetical protein